MILHFVSMLKVTASVPFEMFEYLRCVGILQLTYEKFPCPSRKRFVCDLLALIDLIHINHYNNSILLVPIKLCEDEIKSLCMFCLLRDCLKLVACTYWPM